MIAELSLVAAASMGLFGSGHCVAMCGGISCALTAGLPQTVRRSPWRMLPFVIALGLYLGDWWRGLAAFERLGSKLWRYLQPLGRRFLPVTRWRGAFAVGLLWGWLPCGLVYAALALALAAGGALAGALIMLAFGLGTLPALISLGFAGRWLAALGHPGARRVAGGSLCVLAVVFFLGAFFGDLPGHHHQQPQEKVGVLYAH